MARHQINHLLECSAQLFALAAPLRGRREAQQALPEDFRAQVQAGFDVMERMALERRVPAGELEEAKYALAAFIDESVMASEWSGRAQWMGLPLQLEMFGEHLAGERFFEKLAQFRQGGEQQLPLLELYYACLQLGFEGIYKMRGLERLMALQVDLRSQIEGYRGAPEPRLAPAAGVDRSLLARVGRRIPYSAIGVLTAACILAIYAGFAGSAYRGTEQSLAELEHDAAMLAERATGEAQQ